MNVVILSSGKFPAATPGAKRVGLYSKALTELGHDVSAFGNESRKQRLILFYLQPITVPFRLIAKHFRRLKSADVIFLYGFGWFGVAILFIFSRICRSRLCIEINERPGEAYGSRITELWLIKKMNFIGTHYIAYPLVDGFVVISGALRDYVNKYKRRKAKIIVVPIIVNPSEMQLSTAEISVIKPFIIHSGALSERKDGIVTMFRAIALVNKTLPLHFYLTQKAAPAVVWNEIQQIIRESDLYDRVHFLDELSEPALRAYQKQCALLLLTKPRTKQNLYNFSTKLAEYLAARRPVIATAVGEMAHYLVHRQNALIVPPDDPSSAAQAILEILQDNNLSTKLGMDGEKLVWTDFNYRVAGEKLAIFFNEICSSIRN